MQKFSCDDILYETRAFYRFRDRKLLILLNFFNKDSFFGPITYHNCWTRGAAWRGKNEHVAIAASQKL